MPNLIHTGSKQYRLRAGAPMPIASNNFVLHTFMAESNDIIIYECTDTLLKSNEFRGQGGSGHFMSAQFSRLGDRSGNVFTGKAIDKTVYIEEDALGFNF